MDSWMPCACVLRVGRHPGIAYQGDGRARLGAGHVRAAHVEEEVRNPRNPRRGVIVGGVPYHSRRSAALALGRLCSEVSRVAVIGCKRPTTAFHGAL